VTAAEAAAAMPIGVSLPSLEICISAEALSVIVISIGWLLFFIRPEKPSGSTGMAKGVEITLLGALEV
jgi:hypothetical protein